MRRVIIFAFVTFFSFAAYAHADVGNLQYTQGVAKTVTYSSNLYQILGTGIVGTATSFETYIKAPTGAGGFTPYPKISLKECSDPEYSSCGDEEVLFNEFLFRKPNTFEKYESPISITFNPQKYYLLRFQEVNTRAGYQVAGSVIDTFPNGFCTEGWGLIADYTPCSNNGDGGTIEDLPFNFVGATFESAHSPTSLSSPVIFLPGILGSRLYVVEKNGNLNKAWEGFTGDEMRKLLMNEDGKSLNRVQVGSVMAEFDYANVFKTDIYKSLENYFKCPPSTTPPSFAPVNIANIPGNTEAALCETPFVSYPYDWRYDVFDILDEGVQYTSNTTIHLEDLVKTLAQNSTGKVTILAHSNGGLLAKALMVRLEESGNQNLIDKIIVVGSPQLGTPKAIAAMLHGYEQTTAGGLIKSASVLRLLSLNSPGAYGLLPSEGYFATADAPTTISFDASPSTAPYRNVFGEAIDTYTEFLNFLSNVPSLRSQAPELDLRFASILNRALLEKASATHRKIDSWIPPEEVTFVQIAGVGNKTVTGIEYTTKKVPIAPLGVGGLVFSKKNILSYKPTFSIYGDSEVIDISSAGGVGEKYYFQLGDLLRGEARKKDHSTILTESLILKDIEEIISGNPPSSNYISSTTAALSETKTIAISAHSPVLISATNSFGQTTSITYDEANNLFEKNTGIPGSFVEIIDEGKYLFLPDGDYSITVTGLDVGSFDLVLSEVDSSGHLQEIARRSHIPTTSSSIGTTSITSNSFSALSLDLDGNGSSDFTFSDEDSNTESIAASLKNSFASLPLRPTLHSAINQYFTLLETATDDSDKVNYIAQIKRIIRFLNGRHITQDTADEWTALVDNLQ